jgi:hypothetical protein
VAGGGAAVVIADLFMTDLLTQRFSDHSGHGIRAERHGYQLAGVGELWRGKLPNVQSG